MIDEGEFIMKNQDAMIRKLAEILRNLPSEGCLQMCCTEEDKQRWQEMRHINTWVGGACEAEFNGQDGQYQQFLENQGIDPLKITAIQMAAKEYIYLWKVIQLAEPLVRFFYENIANRLDQEIKSNQFVGSSILNYTNT